MTVDLIVWCSFCKQATWKKNNKLENFVAGLFPHFLKHITLKAFWFDVTFVNKHLGS